MPLLLALLLLAVLAPAASAQALADPAPIAAHGGRLAWSEQTPGGRWQLMTRAAGTTAAVPVPTRGVPFDVDLGPDADGDVVAAYSRCEDEPPGRHAERPIRYDDGRGCDVFRFDFDTGRERPIAGANSTTASEVWPSIWRDEVAFARTYDRKRDYPYLYVRPLEGEATSRRMPGGQRNACTRRTGRRVCTDDRRSAPHALELYGRRLAFGWSFQGFAEGRASEVRLDTVGGAHRRVDSFGGGGLTGLDLSWPAFEAGRLYWSRACFGDGGGCPGRSGLRRLAYGATNAVPTATRTPRFVFSHDRDAGATYVLKEGCLYDEPDGTGRCELAALRPAYE